MGHAGEFINRFIYGNYIAACIKTDQGKIIKIMGTKWLSLYCGIAVFIITADKSGAVDNATRLFNHLLGESSVYNKDVLPQISNNQTVTVSFGLALLKILEVNERSEKIDLEVWIRKAWKDARLSWNPQDFGGIKTMRLPIKSIWRPDVVLYNGDTQENVDAMAVVSSGGSVMHIPPAIISVHCSLDLRNFPFDEHVCYLKFGSWTYDGDTVDVEFFGNANMDTGDLIPGSSFSLTGTGAKKNIKMYPCCTQTFPDLTFNLTLKRRASFASHVGAAPAAITCMLIPVVFLIPTASSSKITLGLGVLVTDVMLFGLLIDEVMDFAHPTIPKIAKYYLVTMVLSVLSLGCAAVILNIWNRASQGVAVPRIVRKIVLDGLGKVMCISKDDHKFGYVEFGAREHGVQQVDAENNESGDKQKIIPNQMHSSAEWRQMAAILDRLLFFVFLLLSVIVSFTMLGK